MKLSFLRPIVLALISVVLYVAGNGSVLQNSIGYGILLLGLIIVGIPHGAVDHLLDSKKWDIKKNLDFILRYLLQAILMGVLWYFIPPLALAIFLVYSAWHFGETDGTQWHLSTATSFFWGVSVLFYILGTHYDETNAIISIIGNVTLPIHCPDWALVPWLLWSLMRKNTNMALTVMWLLLSSQIPLLFAFGLYFIGQHSLTGWNHITAHLNQTQWSIWSQSLPFHAGAWILLGIFYFFWPTLTNQPMVGLSQWGPFFIFLACVSLPHVISMHSLLGKQSSEK